MTGPAIATVFDVFLRMAFDAPGHSHCCNSGDAIHSFDWSVAFLAGEARLDMPLMRKVNKIGHIVHFDPRYRFTIFPVCHQLQNLRLFADAGYRLVTSNAFANTGDAGDRCRVRIDVAVLARNLIVRCMHLVTEFDWLNRTAVRKIFAVHPCAYQQSEHRHKPEQGWLPRGPERIRDRDRQIVPPYFWGKSLPVSRANYKFIADFVLNMIPAWSPQQGSVKPIACNTR